MISPLRLSVAALLAASVLGSAAEPVLAQQFYNPGIYSRTRQATTDRAITKRLGRRPKRKVTKPTTKRSPKTSPKAAPRKPSR
jgi:hypothetical protein